MKENNLRFDVQSVSKDFADALKGAEKSTIEAIKTSMAGFFLLLAESNDVPVFLGKVKKTLGESLKRSAVAQSTARNYRTSVVNALAQVHLGMASENAVLSLNIVSAGFTKSENYAAASQWLVDKKINQGGKSNNKTPEDNKTAESVQVSKKEYERLQAIEKTVKEEVKEEKKQDNLLTLTSQQLSSAQEAAKNLSKEKDKVIKDLESLKAEIVGIQNTAKMCKTAADKNKIIKALISLKLI